MDATADRGGLRACGTVDGRAVYANAPSMDAETAGELLARAMIRMYGGADKLREAILARRDGREKAAR